MSAEANEKKSTIYRVADVVDSNTLVINKGSGDGVKSGQRFLIFAYGKEIVDPDSKESLGVLEIVKGTGRVTHLQENIATIRTDMTAPPQRAIRRVKRTNFLRNYYSLAGGGEEEVEEISPAEPVPFDEPEIGDLARPV